MKNKLLILGLLLTLFLFAFSSFSFAKKSSPKKEEKAAPASLIFVGAQTCMGCHEDRYNSYEKSSHANKNDARTPGAKEECESCHGLGSAHVEAGGDKGVGGIIALGIKSDTPAEKKNETCLSCHKQRKLTMWKNSTHENRGLSCSTCHSLHSGNPKNLAKSTQLEVCSQCHNTILTQTQKTSHHPIKEGKLNCSDCHNPHGTVTEKLISANSVNEKCYECHAEKRGPFLWEHSPVTENCLTCHTPHGSTQDKLLTAKRPNLCQTCHSNSRHPGTLYSLDTTKAGQSVYSASSNRLFYRSCSNCHSQIHGSNHPSGKALGR